MILDIDVSLGRRVESIIVSDSCIACLTGVDGASHHAL